MSVLLLLAPAVLLFALLARGVRPGEAAIGRLRERLRPARPVVRAHRAAPRRRRRAHVPVPAALRAGTWSPRPPPAAAPGALAAVPHRHRTRR